MSFLRCWLTRRRLARPPGAGFYRDPFFADPMIVEDDYRRMSGRGTSHPARTPAA
jgi:hypothetical protein